VGVSSVLLLRLVILVRSLAARESCLLLWSIAVHWVEVCCGLSNPTHRGRRGTRAIRNDGMRSGSAWMGPGDPPSGSACIPGHRAIVFIRMAHRMN